jgi:hypothetical protein
MLLKMLMQSPMITLIMQVDVAFDAEVCSSPSWSSQWTHNFCSTMMHKYFLWTLNTDIYFHLLRWNLHFAPFSEIISCSKQLHKSRYTFSFLTWRNTFSFRIWKHLEALSEISHLHITWHTESCTFSCIHFVDISTFHWSCLRFTQWRTIRWNTFNQKFWNV